MAGLTWIISLLTAFPFSGCEDKADSVRIGFFGPLTGPTAQAGQALRNGALIAIDEINAEGGLLGKPVILIEQDDRSSPEQAVKSVIRLVHLSKVTAIVGSLHSGNILAAAPVIEQSGTPMVGAGTSPTWLEKGYTCLFRAVGNSELSVSELARYAKRAGIKKVSVIQSNDEYGMVGGRLFAEYATRAGIEISANESFTHGDRDFTGQFVKMLKVEPDAVLIWALGDDLGALTKQLRQAGYDGLVLGAEGYTLPQVLKIAGKAADNVVFPAQYLVPEQPQDAPDPLMRSFLTRYFERFGEMPVSDNAFRGYDSVRIIAEAIKRANTLDREKVCRAIGNIEGFEGLAGRFTFKGFAGEGIHEMRFFRITDGKYVEIEH
ncbi:MAG TPA: ABC transporter substrate-binding protein [Sedimentisphaerales bacterium]|nr:ABC transporter substrate-binding protein [Sedimentisphaerales bacterium]